MTAQEYKAPESVGRLEKRALVVGVLGVIASVIGWITKPDTFFQSYLMAFLLVLESLSPVERAAYLLRRRSDSASPPRL